MEAVGLIFVMAYYFAYGLIMLLWWAAIGLWYVLLALFGLAEAGWDEWQDSRRRKRTERESAASIEAQTMDTIDQMYAAGEEAQASWQEYMYTALPSAFEEPVVYSDSTDLAPTYDAVQWDGYR